MAKKKVAEKEEAGRKSVEKEPQKGEFKHLVRVAGTDLDGNKKVPYSLSKIVGIGLRTGEVICEISGVDPNKRIGYLSDDEIERLSELAENLQKERLPSWLFNRRNDFDTGEDRHVIGSDRAISIREDINRMKKIKSYKGIRHIVGLPVRGQRTRTSFRAGMTVGVSRRKARELAAKKK
jgi:small subunit ribosomal protein S13